jgi:hypothetical protein
MRKHIKDNKVLSSSDVGSFSEDLEDNYSKKGSEEEYSELFNFYINHSDDRVIIQNRSRSRSYSCSEDHNDYKNSCSNECEKDLDIETNCQRIEKTTKSTMTIRNKLKQNDENTITSESEVLTTVENAIVPYDINVPNNDRQQQSSSIVPYFTIFMIMMNCKDLLKIILLNYLNIINCLPHYCFHHMLILV